MSGQSYVWVVYYGNVSAYEHEKVFTSKVAALKFKYKMWDQGYQAFVEKRYD